MLRRRSNRTHAPLHAIGIDLDASVVKELHEPIPMVQRVANCPGGWSAAGHLWHLHLEPSAELCTPNGYVLSSGMPFGRTEEADLGLDPIRVSVSVLSAPLYTQW
jgi:hypothetical protein